MATVYRRKINGRALGITAVCIMVLPDIEECPLCGRRNLLSYWATKYIGKPTCKDIRYRACSAECAIWARTLGDKRSKSTRHDLEHKIAVNAYGRVIETGRRASV
jgi:hypothetical protein